MLQGLAHQAVVVVAAHQHCYLAGLDALALQRLGNVLGRGLGHQVFKPAFTQGVFIGRAVMHHPNRQTAGLMGIARHVGRVWACRQNRWKVQGDKGFGMLAKHMVDRIHQGRGRAVVVRQHMHRVWVFMLGFGAGL